MSTDMASVGLRVDSRQVRTASGDLDRFARSGDKAGRSANRANTSFGGMARGAAGAAVAMAAAAVSVAAIGAALATGIRNQLAFGSALAETSTLLNGNAAEMAIVTQASKDLTATYGGTATAQAQGFYQAISAGAGSAAQATELLDTANQLAIGGITSVTTAVNILTTATNVYASEGLLAADASDALFVAMKAGKTTIDELASSLGKVLPLSQNLGVSFDETAATIAALTKSGIATTEAVTGMRAAMTAVLGPSKQASDLAKELGIDFNAAGLQAVGFSEFMADVTRKTGGSSEAMQTLFGSVEATTVALSLSGAAGGFLADILGDMETKAGATATAFGLMADDDAQRLRVAMGQLHVSMLDLGSAALTTLVPAVEAIAGIAKLAADNADVLAIALGGLAVTQVYALIGALGKLVFALGTAQSVFATSAVAAGGLALAMNAIPFVAAITAATLLYRAYRDMGDTTGVAAVVTETLAGSVENLNTALDVYANERAEPARQAAIESAKAMEAEAIATLAAVSAKLAYLRAIDNPLFQDGSNEPGGLLYDVGLQAAEAERQLENARRTIQGLALDVGAAANNAGELAGEAEVVSNVISGINFSRAIDGAQSLADRLGISLGLARAIALTAGSAGVGDEVFDRRSSRFNAGAQNAANRAAKLAEIRQSFADAAAEAARLDAELGNIRGGTGAAAELDAMASEIERLEFEADPVKKYTAELANLDKLLAGGLSDGAYAKAVRDLNEQFSKTSPNIQKAADAIGDFVAGGMRDFGSLLDSFKNMLRQMISTAISNPIRIALTTAFGGGGAGQAVAGVAGGGPLGGAGGGLLGGLVGSFGTGGGMAGLANGAGFLGGVGNVLGGLASGGLSGGIGAIGSALGGATASLGGFAMAAGAIAVPLLAIAGIFMAFRTKTKELDAGIIATVTGMDTLVQSFRTVEKSRFFGLSKSVSTTIGAAGQATTDAITDIVGTLQGSVMASADALGLAGDTFEDFSHRMRISTKGLSEEAANEAVQEALMGMADAMAGMVSGLDAFARDGEGAAATLERLAQSLIVVNARMADLGMNTYAVSLAGAGAASAFVDLFGSLENFNAVSQSYYQNFFTDAERLARATELLSIEMLALGINALPSTRAAFRALIDEADALGDSGLVASLMQLSPAFAEISAGADALGDSLRSLVNEDLFTTGQDYTRALSRSSNSQTFTPQQSDAELRAELRALNVSMERLVSTSEITAGNTGRGADAADDTLAFQLEQTL